MNFGKNAWAADTIVRLKSHGHLLTEDERKSVETTAHFVGMQGAMMPPEKANFSNERWAKDAHVYALDDDLLHDVHRDTMEKFIKTVLSARPTVD